MGQRRRKKQRLSSAQRDDQARAALEPLAAGERPLPVTIAAGIAAAVGGANLVLYAAGVEIQGKRPSAVGTLAFCAVMLSAAWGMWHMRYWAVLGFQALLAIVILVFSLFLLRASNLEAVVVCVVIIGGGGWLFFKLVRAMARMQMPQRPVS